MYILGLLFNSVTETVTYKPPPAPTQVHLPVNERIHSINNISPQNISILALGLIKNGFDLI